MAAPCSLDVEIRGIGAAYMPHDLRKVTDRGFDQEVIMAVYQAECVDNRIVPFGGRLNLAAFGGAFRQDYFRVPEFGNKISKIFLYSLYPEHRVLIFNCQFTILSCLKKEFLNSYINKE